MREYEAISRRIRADAPRRILDWGCGFGQVSDLLWRAGLEVTSFDYSPAAQDGVVPLDRYPHLAVHLSSDPRRLPFPDGSFDAVLSCGVLEHVEDPDASVERSGAFWSPAGRSTSTSYRTALRTWRRLHGVQASTTTEQWSMTDCMTGALRSS